MELERSSFEAVQIPHNSVAERELLGAILINNRVIENVGDFLIAEHFYEPVHQRIYAAIREMVASGEVANPITLKRRFDTDGALADIGGARYLVMLAAQASPILSAADYGLEIYRCWQRRQIIEWCGEAIAASRDAESGCLPDEVAARLIARANDMHSTDKRRVVIRADELTSVILDGLTREKECHSTGLARLDKAMGGGLYSGYTYGFAARKKVGKTILAGTLSYNLDRQGVPHLFIAGEMGAEQIHQRLLARHAGVSSAAFRLKGMQNQSFHNSICDYQLNNGKNIHFQNAPGLTFDDLKQYMSRAVNRLKVKGIILDYWQLVGGKAQKESEAKHLDAVAQWIADFCREHKIWSVVFAQINQDGNTRGGEGLRLACDQMYQIYRPDVTLPYAYVEMMDTRYTEWGDIGDEHNPAWELAADGQYFREI